MLKTCAMHFRYSAGIDRIDWDFLELTEFYTHKAHYAILPKY